MKGCGGGTIFGRYMGIFLKRSVLSGCFATACFFFLCHCGIRPSSDRPSYDGLQHSEARRFLQEILVVNTRLETLKGMGRVTLHQNGQSNVFDAAWMGKRPDHFRLEVLGVTGQPMMSFASNGKRHYFLSYSDNHLYSRRASRKVLKRITDIALTPEEILDLLSGRLPVHPDSRVWTEDGGETNNITLMLESPENGYHDRIFFNMVQPPTFYEMERRDRYGKLLFRAELRETKEDEGFLIPGSVIISNEDGAMIQISVEKCWKNQDIPDDRFVLKSL